MVLLLAFLFALPGCHVDRTLDPTPYLINGDYGRARTFIHKSLTNKRSEREYLLDRMQLGVLTLADGYPQSAQIVFEEVYEVLRTQGINADKTVASVVLNEDVKIWKGEPFEQALAFAYYGMQQAMLGQWDNTRAAAGNSLFQLRDFGKNAQGEQIDTQEIARRALIAERNAAGTPDPEKDYFNTGYAVRESNFTLGYMLRGIAAQQLGRAEEGSDHLNVAAQVDPRVRPVIDQLKTGKYNTILVVSYGIGPQKIAYGMDNALSKFAPRFNSDGDPLILRAGSSGGGKYATYPQVCDVNAMAADHMWNNLEDVRQAKSVIGTGLLAAGAITTGIGASEKNKTAALVGVGLMVAGAALKTSAHADTRFCNGYPQRFYIVPLMVGSANTSVELQVQGRPASKLVLTGLSPPPPGEPAQLRYVRLVSGHPRAQQLPQGWAVSGRLYYSTHQAGVVEKNPLPWVLGGADVRVPDADVMKSYANQPTIQFATPAELEQVWRSRGIFLTAEDQQGYAGLHVLEGGNSLVEPMAGTAGFVRLFGQIHPEYRGR